MCKKVLTYPPPSYLYISFATSPAFINSFTLLLPLVHFALLCLPGRVSVQAGLRRKSDKWAEERGIGSEPGPNERERRADAEREKAANGSLRVDIMRNRGEGSWGGWGGRSEDKSGEGEKRGRVEWYMGKRALRQRDGKGKVVNGRVKADEGSWRWCGREGGG